MHARALRLSAEAVAPALPGAGAVRRGRALRLHPVRLARRDRPPVSAVAAGAYPRCRALGACRRARGAAACAAPMAERNRRAAGDKLIPIRHPTETKMTDTLREAALDYHRYPTPGKISVTPTKAMATQRDLGLAYSPGVAEACLAIVEDPREAGNLTARNNLVAVITNGTAVLGLGNIGALAGKPVMEGKGCLFKKFAGIDVFDIELDELDPDKLIDTIARMEPTFGGINLEDIKAPECFYIEKKLRERMKIPVFHDDQHGTAIVAAAAILNALRLVKKDIAEVKLVCSGAGAAALACLDLIVSLGLPMRNVFVSDSAGVVYVGRKEQMDPNKARYAQETSARKLVDIIEGADIFLGLSAGGVDRKS